MDILNIWFIVHLDRKMIYNMYPLCVCHISFPYPNTQTPSSKCPIWNGFGTGLGLPCLRKCVPTMICFLPKCPNNQICGTVKSIPNSIQWSKPVKFFPEFGILTCQGRLLFSDFVILIFVSYVQIHQFYLTLSMHQSPKQR